MTDTDANTDDVRAAVINTRDRVGFALLVVIFLGGLWLMAAPFIVGYQVRAAHWTHGTTDEFVVGAALAVLSLATLVVCVGGALRELSRRTPSAPTSGSAASAGPDGS